MISISQKPERRPDETMTQYVMKYVREQILLGEMNTTDWYSVYQLADELNMSRSPCRDALLRLEESGLIRFTRNRGFQVVETTPENIAQDFALRLGIEPKAAYRAAQYITPAEVDRLDSIQRALTEAARNNEAQIFFEWDLALHDIILLTGKTPRGRRLVDQIRNNTRLLGVGTYPGARTLDDICREHQPIIDALRHGDGDLAEKMMSEHLHSSGCLLVRQCVERQNPKLEADEAITLSREIWEEHTLGF